MRRLRAGCPWDRKQTLESLRPYLLEEAYEVLDVMCGADPARHRDELGDLLFQVVFQTRIRQEQGAFELADVVDGICDKLERRHPHVFGDESLADAAAVTARWEDLKAVERQEEGAGAGALDGVPLTLPALSRAAKIGRRASRVGFDWPTIDGPQASLRDEVAELEEAIQARDVPAALHELGDVLFAAVNIARHLRIDPELALRATTERFERRFRWIEAHLAADGGQVPADADLETLDALWRQAKRDLERPDGPAS